MLSIDRVNESITLTKGDSGIITISLSSTDASNATLINNGLLSFYVRNKLNLDDVVFSISETAPSNNEPTDPSGDPEPSDSTDSDTSGTEINTGTIERLSDNPTGTQRWTIAIHPDATKELRRKTYYYDFKLATPDGSQVVTFKGGDKHKCEFILT